MGKLRTGAVTASFVALAVSAVLAGCGQEKPVAKPVIQTKAATLPLQLPDLDPPLYKPQPYEQRLQTAMAPLVKTVAGRAAAPLPSYIGDCITELRETALAYYTQQLVRSHDLLVEARMGLYAHEEKLGGWDDKTITRTGQRLEKLEAECRRQLPLMDKNYDPVFDITQGVAHEARQLIFLAIEQQGPHMKDYLDQWASQKVSAPSPVFCAGMDSASNLWRTLLLRSFKSPEKTEFADKFSTFFEAYPHICPPPASRFTL